MKLLDFILCDDIRAEISNKHTLVGVYNDLFQVQTKSIKELKLPLAFRLAFYLRIDVENVSDIRAIHFKFSGKSVDEFAGVFHMQNPIDTTRPLVLVAAGFSLAIKDQGKIDVEFECRDNAGKTIALLRPNGSIAVQFKEI